ncbi:hypothetical protein LCGC14_3011700, partial [marine sediment metagenome]
MKDKLNQFISNLNGQFVEVSYKKALYQCMDLAYNWAFALNIPKATIQRLYAYEVFTKATDLTREYFDVIPNTPDGIPQDGDLVVFKGGKAGHIAIALGGGNTRSFMRFEQNNPLGTHAHVQSGGYVNILGWLRPKFATIEGVPQWINTLLQERNLTLKNEPEIRSLFDKAKRYDEEVKTLQEQVKTVNQQLADKALELSDTITKLQKLTSEHDGLQKNYGETKTERDDLSWKVDKFE